jgi:cellulose synthase/poly-beta-1,6-N-acetylglucosamine synthase-like glycosyltransferase
VIDIIVLLSQIIIIYFFFLSTWYGITLFASFPDIWRSYQEVLYGDMYRLLEKRSHIPLTIVMPVYNEENRILNSVYGVLRSYYKNVHVMLVLDGSTDNTLAILRKEFDLYEIPPVIKQVLKTQPVKNMYKSAKYDNITVIYKEHSPDNNGADSINCGINALASPIFLTVDADTILEPHALTYMLFRFLSDKHTIMVAGCCYVLNENKVEHGRLLTHNLPKSLVPAFQALEYLRSFTYARAGLSHFSGVLCSPGAFTMVETYIVKEAKGFNSQNFAYDTEITLSMHAITRAMKYPTKILFMPTAISWTEVPGTLKRFWQQRSLWHRGMIRAVSNYKRMFLNPRYGTEGLLTFPLFILFDIGSPLIEFTSYFLFGLAFYLNLFELHTFLWFMFLAWGFVVIMSIFSFYLDLITAGKYKNFGLLRLIWLVTLEMFGFRQFRAAACTYGVFYYIYRRLTGHYM